MTLQEYLHQENPVKMPNVIVKKNEYTIASTHTLFKNSVREETHKRVYFKTKNSLLAGVEYCLIGTHFYAVDGDGNPKGRSCFSIPIEDSIYAEKHKLKVN